MLDENPNDVENVPQSPLFANESTPLLILLLTVRTFNPTILQIPRLISQESAKLPSSVLTTVRRHSARTIGLNNQRQTVIPTTGK